MSPAIQATLDRLDDTRQRWWMFSLACNVVLWLAVSLALLLMFVLLDVAIGLSRGWLLAFFLCWLAATAAQLGFIVVRLFRHPRTLEGAARRVEIAFPEIGNSLMALMQLSRLPADDDDGFRRVAIAEAARQTASVPFHRAAEAENRWGRLLLGLQTPRDLVECSVVFAAIIGVAFFLHWLLPAWGSSTDRMLTPWKFVPQVGRVKIVEVQPGHTEVLVGAGLEIVARIEKPPGMQPKGTLILIDAHGQETSQPMMPDEAWDVYSARLAAVLEPQQYRLQIGDTQSEIFRIGVQQKPVIEAVEVTYQFPTYLEQPDRVVQQSQADLEAPQFTRAFLRIRASAKLQQGHVLHDGQRVAGAVEDDGRTLKVGLTLVKSGTFTVHLVNEFGHTDAEPRVNNIRTIPDAPPTVQIAQPQRDLTAAVGGELPIVVRATDDHGLGQVRLEAKALFDETDAARADVPGGLMVLQRWDKLANAAATTRRHVLQLEAARFQPGQTLWIRGVAVDRRQFNSGTQQLEPQAVASGWRRVRLIDPAQEAAESLARWEGVNARLWDMLRLQLRARVQTATLTRAQPAAAATGSTADSPDAIQDAPAAPSAGAAPDRVARTLTEIRQAQIRIQTSAAELADTLQSRNAEDEASVLRVLKKAAYGDMLAAVQQAEQLSRGGSPEKIDAGAVALLPTQDRIIATLRQLLDAARQAVSKELSEMKERPGGDLPSDVVAKLAKLDEKLQEFLKQQRKVIEATENLAKKPVEDFTEEDEQLLKQLAAIEEDWSRFMEEMHSDFSKLPEQDFSNPSLLEELIEIQTELKMAAGALTKKTADIAVPLEQLGAEMAEEMTTNIEKWLPDSPDRERWSQEEPLTDEMKEAPMAELPGELEDLVGELMEDEEDLFDEMEDVTSSWADSLDKGAGWDAMDGPISNMSARGVTGNRLPNTSEIGGRSGEGRQGQASGEFVADTAVGKGGRKTPSRLAPDPFTKGQVKDFSKDPVGGATGGGKESGVGGEGLEGPVPHRPQRELERLASKQAELRNRAEAIDLKFQVLNYHPTDLKKLMDAMAAVEVDLRAGRYENALRRREVLLGGLDNIKTYLEGEFELRRDETANLPEEIQKEILGGMLEASPSGWEDFNRQYFERLAKERGAAEAGDRQAPASDK